MSDPSGPRTIAARALLTRAPGGRQTMRGVAVAELSKLLARIEQEAAEPYRAELRWVLDELDRCQSRLNEGGAAPAPTAGELDHRGRIRQLLSRV